MSNIKLCNGSILRAFIGGDKPANPCDCIGADVALVLSTMGMAGSNLFNMYPGQRCTHGNPIKSGPVAYIVENYKEESLKFKGRANIKGMLDHVMKGSVALVFFRTFGAHQTATLDLYVTNKLWINSGVADEADEMWVWVLGGKAPKTAQKHHSKSHHKQVVVF